MKKVLFFLIAACFALNVFANDESIKKANYTGSLNNFLCVDDSKKATYVLNETQPFCRACCTVSATSLDGQQITQTACLRNSDCTTAAVSACDAARLAALVRVMQ